MTAVLKNPTWFPLLYGLGVFVFSLSEVADTTPKQMTDYLNAVRWLHLCTAMAHCRDCYCCLTFAVLVKCC